MAGLARNKERTVGNGNGNRKPTKGLALAVTNRGNARPDGTSTVESDGRVALGDLKNKPTATNAPNADQRKNRLANREADRKVLRRGASHETETATDSPVQSRPPQKVFSWVGSASWGGGSHAWDFSQIFARCLGWLG